mgnify:CR=1 FL=1
MLQNLVSPGGASKAAIAEMQSLVREVVTGQAASHTINYAAVGSLLTTGDTFTFVYGGVTITVTLTNDATDLQADINTALGVGGATSGDVTGAVVSTNLVLTAVGGRSLGVGVYTDVDKVLTIAGSDTVLVAAAAAKSTWAAIKTLMTTGDTIRFLYNSVVMTATLTNDWTDLQDDINTALVAGGASNADVVATFATNDLILTAAGAPTTDTLVGGVYTNVDLALTLTSTDVALVAAAPAYTTWVGIKTAMTNNDTIVFTYNGVEMTVTLTNGSTDITTDLNTALVAGGESNGDVVASWANTNDLVFTADDTPLIDTITGGVFTDVDNANAETAATDTAQAVAAGATATYASAQTLMSTGDTLAFTYNGTGITVTLTNGYADLQTDINTGLVAGSKTNGDVLGTFSGTDLVLTCAGTIATDTIVGGAFTDVDKALTTTPTDVALVAAVAAYSTWAGIKLLLSIGDTVVFNYKGSGLITATLTGDYTTLQTDVNTALVEDGESEDDVVVSWSGNDLILTCAGAIGSDTIVSGNMTDVDKVMTVTGVLTALASVPVISITDFLATSNLFSVIGFDGDATLLADQVIDFTSAMSVLADTLAVEGIAKTAGVDAIVTITGHGLLTGDYVLFDSTVVGATELNAKGFTITKIDDNTFYLDGALGGGYTAYVSGGILTLKSAKLVCSKASALYRLVVDFHQAVSA